MQITLKALSALLSYPTPDLQEAIAPIREAFAEDTVLPDRAVAKMTPLLDELATGDIYDLQEQYVGLFDRSRSLSLNLFEHVHGESRDRGGAMVDLLETYRAGGYEPVGPELPDHLPLLLEFLATRPLPEARATLADAGHIFDALQVRLTRRESTYAAVLQALCLVAGARPDAAARAALAAEVDDDPDDLAALDAAWQETEVTFGPDPNAGCPATREALARMEAPRNKPAGARVPAPEGA